MIVRRKHHYIAGRCSVASNVGEALRVAALAREALVASSVEEADEHGAGKDGERADDWYDNRCSNRGEAVGFRAGERRDVRRGGGGRRVRRRGRD